MQHGPPDLTRNTQQLNTDRLSQHAIRNNADRNNTNINEPHEPEPHEPEPHEPGCLTNRTNRNWSNREPAELAPTTDQDEPEPHEPEPHTNRTAHETVQQRMDLKKIEPRSS